MLGIDLCLVGYISVCHVVYVSVRGSTVPANECNARRRKYLWYVGSATWSMIGLLAGSALWTWLIIAMLSNNSDVEALGINS